MGINDVIAQEVLLTCTIAQEVLYIYYLSVRPLVLSNKQASAIPPPNSHNPTPATAPLPPGEGSNSPPATVHLSLEGDSFLNSQANNSNNITINSVNNQANSQGPSPNHTLAIAHLPPREGSNSLLGAVHLLSEDDSSPLQIGSTPTREENNSSQATPPPVSNNPQSSRSPRQGKVITPPGQTGKALGTPQATTCSTFPGGLHNLQGR